MSGPAKLAELVGFGRQSSHERLWPSHTAPKRSAWRCSARPRDGPRTAGECRHTRQGGMLPRLLGAQDAALSRSREDYAISRPRVWDVSPTDGRTSPFFLIRAISTSVAQIREQTPAHSESSALNASEYFYAYSTAIQGGDSCWRRSAEARGVSRFLSSVLGDGPNAPPRYP